MDWKDEELDEGERVMTYPVSPPKDSTHRRETVRAIMTRAVELAAARGGTMTGAEVARWRLYATELRGGAADLAHAILAHATALGARNAVLEAENARLRRERYDALDAKTTEGLSAAEWQLRTGKAERERTEACAENERLKERLSAAEESNRELVRRAQQAEAQRDGWRDEHGAVMRRWKAEKERAETAEARCATLSAAGQVLSAHVDKVEACEVAPGATFADTGQRRYPCSSTCTHDDAATPGHPDRVKERSEAFREATGLNKPTQWGMGYEAGAEAMRAACWEAVQHELEKAGLTGHRKAFKSAIEGAAP